MSWKSVTHPYCNVCGWRKGGTDSWNGFACKCGDSAPAIQPVEPKTEKAKLVGSPKYRLLLPEDIGPRPRACTAYCF
jgi:hypothetical protein